jgi:TM2 domain-containing membrane protein YozV
VPPRYCSNCGTQLVAGAVQCHRCGVAAKAPFPGQKSKLAAGLLGILVPFGVHSFYLGDTKKGVIQLLVTIFTCGLASLWSFIEGILILVGNINTDAEGRPLGE